MSDSFKQIVVDLAAWSSKYPRSRIYNASSSTMDEELIALEERAVALSEQSDDTVEAKILQSGGVLPVQQLKAEIRSVVGILNAAKSSGHTEDTEWCINRLRELSAV